MNMRMKPAIKDPDRRPGVRLLVRTAGIVVAGTAFVASIVQIGQGVGPRESSATPTIVVEPPIVVVPSPDDSANHPVHAGATAPVSGPWNLHTIVEQCSYAPYDGLRCVYRLNLIEAKDGNVTGSGELWSENGEEVTGLNHLIMTLSGHFDGTTLRVTYSLAGRERPSTGALYLDFDEETGSWRGRFDSTVAASSGPAELVPR